MANWELALKGVYTSKLDLKTTSVAVTPSGQGKSVTVRRYLLTMTLFGDMGFTKTVTVSRVSL